MVEHTGAHLLYRCCKRVGRSVFALVIGDGSPTVYLILRNATHKVVRSRSIAQVHRCPIVHRSSSPSLIEFTDPSPVSTRPSADNPAVRCGRSVRYTRCPECPQGPGSSPGPPSAPAAPAGPAGPWQATSATRIRAVSGNAATFAARVILMLFSFPLRTFDTAQETRAPSGLKRRYEVSRHSRLSMGPIYLLPATSRTVSQVRGPAAAVAEPATRPPTRARDSRLSRRIAYHVLHTRVNTPPDQFSDRRPDGAPAPPTGCRAASAGPDARSAPPRRAGWRPAAGRFEGGRAADGM